MTGTVFSVLLEKIVGPDALSAPLIMHEKILKVIAPAKASAYLIRVTITRHGIASTPTRSTSTDGSRRSAWTAPKVAAIFLSLLLAGVEYKANRHVSLMFISTCTPTHIQRITTFPTCSISASLTLQSRLVTS